VIQQKNVRTVSAKTGRRLMELTMALAVAAGTVSASPALAALQDDGTGGSSQASPGDCAIVASSVDPARVSIDLESAETGSDATPGPELGDATPVATPAAGDAATPVASPMSAEESSYPVAPLRDELLTTTESLFACLNERTFDTFARLTSDSYRGQLFGSDQPLPADSFIGLAASLPDSDHRVVALDSVDVFDETTVNAEVTYLSAFQQHTAIWTFTRLSVDGIVTWVVENEQRIPVPAAEGMTTISVVFEENGYQVTPAAVIGSDVVLNLNNPTDEDHEALILRFDAGVGANDLLQNTSASLPDGVTLVGQSTVLAGDQGTMFLTGLESGTYTIVDLLPDENGIPHLSSGMVATFRVIV